MDLKRIAFIAQVVTCIVLFVYGAIYNGRSAKELIYTALFFISSTTLIYAYLFSKPLPMDRDVPVNSQRRKYYIFMPIILMFSGCYIALNGLT